MKKKTKKRKKHPIVQAETEDGQMLGVIVVEVIENQLQDNHPPEVAQTLARLIEDGETHENAMRMIGCCLVKEMWLISRLKEPFAQDRYVASLHALPTLPDWANLIGLEFEGM